MCWSPSALNIHASLLATSRWSKESWLPLYEVSFLSLSECQACIRIHLLCVWIGKQGRQSCSTSLWTGQRRWCIDYWKEWARLSVCNCFVHLIKTDTKIVSFLETLDENWVKNSLALLVVLTLYRKCVARAPEGWKFQPTSFYGKLKLVQIKWEHTMRWDSPVDLWSVYRSKFWQQFNQSSG